MPILNDVQSRLNETEILRIVRPKTAEDVRHEIEKAALDGIAICPSGSLHSMGGQQFAESGVSMSSSNLKEIGPLDAHNRTVWIQSGVTWPELVRWLREAQRGTPDTLSIIQKQTGADEMTLGGALSSNIHGRVLGRRPIVADIEEFYMTTAQGERVFCSRESNPELFGLAIGGYGLFGFVDSVKLALESRTQMVRRVAEIETGEVMSALQQRMEEGATYGDFQYMTDESSADFMNKGIVSTYSPMQFRVDAPRGQLGLTAEDWLRLYVLAHTDKSRAYDEYAGHYLKTDDQVYWSDEHQFSPYLPEAGDMLASRLGWRTFASLMISELYVPIARFAEFMRAARKSLLDTEANVVYGTVRLILREDETYLRWAREDYACVIFNLLVEHSSEGITRAKKQFQALIDCALDEGGGYYLTYHRWARKDQVEKAYPQFRSFLEMKDRYDPNRLFTSEWHRHYVEMFA